MMKAIFQDSWRNGDGGAVKEYKLEPPYQGNKVVHVTAFRSVTKRMVTVVATIDGENLCECIDGSSAHAEALALIGYTVN